MLELTALILFNRLTNWGRAPLIASRVIAADASTLHALIADPATQRRIVDDVHGLLHAHAQAGPSASSRLVAARVQLGGHDALSLTWILSPSRGTTEVDLVAQIESHGLLARLTMLLGGRRWLRHRLEGTLVTWPCSLTAQPRTSMTSNAGRKSRWRPTRRRASTSTRTTVPHRT